MSNNYAYLQHALRVINFLQANSIDPILYGSLGVSLYLGQFKTFNDIDLLVKEDRIVKRWPELQKLMANNGFELVDEREHEFKNGDGLMVAFAAETVLTRDNIVDSLDEVIAKTISGVQVRTLTPELFKKAYLFSEKDGYRRLNRGKKDRQVIELLDAFIRQ